MLFTLLIYHMNILSFTSNIALSFGASIHDTKKHCDIFMRSDIYHPTTIHYPADQHSTLMNRLPSSTSSTVGQHNIMAPHVFLQPPAANIIHYTGHIRDVSIFLSNSQQTILIQISFFHYPT